MEPLGRESHSYSTVTNEQQSLKGGESVEYDGRSGRPKDANTDENVKDGHTLIRVIEGDTCEV